MNADSLQIANHHAAGREVVMTGLISDDMSEPSSPEAGFDDGDILGTAIACADDVTAQLVAAGPVGVAAAAAIISGKKRRRHHSFEINPSIRKRQQTRLLRKLKNVISEYTVRVGQQAAILVCTPGKMNQTYQSFKVFGSQPLENVIRSQRDQIMATLENALIQHTPPTDHEAIQQHELPPLVIDGLPTPVDKMTQAQLRAFIPEMLKYSTGRSKPGWGKQESRPPWWPVDVPWANVRSDVRSGDEKRRVSWTHAMRCIVRNCYKHHHREDLLPVFEESTQYVADPTQYPAGTMVQTISNPDGTLSIIQIDTGAQNGTVVTLPDGTQATVVHSALTSDGQTAVPHSFSEATINQDGQIIITGDATLGAVDGAGNKYVACCNLESDAEATSSVPYICHTYVPHPFSAATINQDGQIIITGDATLGAVDGAGNKYGIVTIPVSMYQSVAASAGLANMQITETNSIQISDTSSLTITDNTMTITDNMMGDGDDPGMDGNGMHMEGQMVDGQMVDGNMHIVDGNDIQICDDNIHDNIHIIGDTKFNVQIADAINNSGINHHRDNSDDIGSEFNSDMQMADCNTELSGDTHRIVTIKMSRSTEDLESVSVPDASAAVEVETGS